MLFTKPQRVLRGHSDRLYPVWNVPSPVSSVSVNGVSISHGFKVLPCIQCIIKRCQFSSAIHLPSCLTFHQRVVLMHIFTISFTWDENTVLSGFPASKATSSDPPFSEAKGSAPTHGWVLESPKSFYKRKTNWGGGGFSPECQ